MIKAFQVEQLTGHIKVEEKKDTISFHVGGFKQIYINGGISNWKMKGNRDSPLFYMKTKNKSL